VAIALTNQLVPVRIVLVVRGHVVDVEQDLGLGPEAAMFGRRRAQNTPDQLASSRRPCSDSDHATRERPRQQRRSSPGSAQGREPRRARLRLFRRSQVSSSLDVFTTPWLMRSIKSPFSSLT
jgi:hypothetical protein